MVIGPAQHCVFPAGMAIGLIQYCVFFPAVTKFVNLGPETLLPSKINSQI